MVKRFGVFALVAVQILAGVSVAFAGGGEAPPPPGFVASRHATITGTIVIDPHMRAGEGVGPRTIVQPDGSVVETTGILAADVTPTAKYAFVRLQPKKGQPAAAGFRINAGKLLYLGCDLGASGNRFVYSASNGVYLSDWIPQADLVALFTALGETVTPVTHDPIITAITGQACVADPANTEQTNNPHNVYTDGTPDDSSDNPREATLPGWLVMDVVIDFQVPAKGNQ